MGGSKMQVPKIEVSRPTGDHTELIDWMSKIKNKPNEIFIVHGEKRRCEALQKGIKETYKWDSGKYTIVQLLKKFNRSHQTFII